jgi:serine protease Do
MGLRVQDITPELMQSLDLDSQDGVLVADVLFDSAASTAGIRRGDVISEINREAINNLNDYQEKMRKLDAEETVLFLIKRGGSTIYIAVKMKSNNK